MSTEKEKTPGLNYLNLKPYRLIEEEIRDEHRKMNLLEFLRDVVGLDFIDAEE